MPLPCFVCGTQLEPAIPGEEEDNQPAGGTTFRALGNYGSTIYDPVGMPSTHIEINICDNCLKDKIITGGRVYLVHIDKRFSYEYLEFTLDKIE